MRAPLAERAIVGNLLHRPSLLDKVTLTEKHFFEFQEKLIFRAILAQHARLEDDNLMGTFDAVVHECNNPKISYSDLAEYTTTSEHLFFLDVKEISQAKVSREFLALTDEMDKAHRDGLEFSEVKALYRQRMADIDQNDGDDDVVTFQSLVTEKQSTMLDLIERRERGEEVYTDIPTGIATLDDIIGGLPIGTTTVIAARPAEGKSAFALNVADNIAARGIGVHLLSYEDAESEFHRRWIAMKARIPIHEINAQVIETEQLGRIGRIDSRGIKNMVIQTAHGLDVHGIRKAFKRAQRKIGTRVVIVDYLQMIPGSDKKPRHEQLEESMIEFAALAATEKVAMVVLSQLNRESTKRDMNGGGSSVPRLSDLRGSGSIEQVGKLIIALHTLDHTLDTLGLYVLKNSQGRRGNVTVGFERQYCDIG